jgi:pilus assembly protein Flp/PilA
MFRKFVDFLRDEEGLTAVEYAVAGALVAATVVGAFKALGGNITTTITALSNHVLGN